MTLEEHERKLKEIAQCFHSCLNVVYRGRSGEISATADMLYLITYHKDLEAQIKELEWRIASLEK